METLGGAPKTARKAGDIAGRVAAAACDAQKSVDDRRILNEAGTESGTGQNPGLVKGEKAKNLIQHNSSYEE